MFALNAVDEMASNWWSFLVRGIIAILFGLAIVLNPAVSIAVFVFFFAGFAFVDGVMALLAAFRTSTHRGWLILEGVLGIGLGLLAFFEPLFTLATLALFLAYTIAAWALLTGIAEVTLAIRLRKEGENQWFLIIIGILSIVLGIYLFVFPGLALAAWIWYVAFYAFFSGIAFIAFAFKLKGIKDKTGTAVA